MTKVFKYDGQYQHSSQIPDIIRTAGGARYSREAFWEELINNESAALPKLKSEEKPVYIATGGGYGAYNDLGQFIPSSVTSIRGEKFRNDSAFTLEKKQVEAQIRKHLGQSASEQDVERVWASFYSDECNTKIAKNVVKQALIDGNSVAYESASIYPDTIERAELAKGEGAKTVLLAGTQSLRKALKTRPHDDPYNIAVSYQKFAARFEKELVPLFDEIRLYNTEGDTPILIAKKKGAGQELQIQSRRLYREFLHQQCITPDFYKTQHTEANVTALEHISGTKEQCQTPQMMR